MTLYHLVHEPSPSPGKPPLLILLHGVGSNEHDLFGLAESLDPRFFIVSVRAPIPMGPASFGWYHVQFTPTGPLIDEVEAEQARVLLLRFLSELIDEYPVDPERVYLLGFSQGCAMALAVALTAPDKIAGIVGMSGRLPPGIQNKVSPALGKLHALIVHGTQDTVLPRRFGHEIRDFLATTGINLQYYEFPLGHSVSMESLAVVQAWLSARLS